MIAFKIFLHFCELVLAKIPMHLIYMLKVANEKLAKRIETSLIDFQKMIYGISFQCTFFSTSFDEVQKQ